jgi:glycosyltransferase involved in cell wall biosynthesis
MADLTIGFPVYNGGVLLSRALESLLKQTYPDFVLHISDNGSTDDTARLCRQFAAQDRRIVYTRQPQNIGLVKNFRFLLRQARTPFFMWAAHDDWWHPTFVERNISELKQDPRAIASISRIGNCREGTQVNISLGTSPLRGSAKENMRVFWSNPQDAVRLWAVFRTEAIRNSFPNLPWLFHAIDYTIVGLTLQFGGYIEIPEVLMWREMPEKDRYLKIVDRQYFVFRLFPSLPLSFYMLRYCHPSYYGTFIRALISINVRSHRWYMWSRFPSAVIALHRVLPWLYPEYCVKAAQQHLSTRRPEELASN